LPSVVCLSATTAPFDAGEDDAELASPNAAAASTTPATAAAPINNVILRFISSLLLDRMPDGLSWRSSRRQTRVRTVAPPLFFAAGPERAALVFDGRNRPSVFREARPGQERCRRVRPEARPSSRPAACGRRS